MYFTANKIKQYFILLLLLCIWYKFLIICADCSNNGNVKFHFFQQIFIFYCYTIVNIKSKQTTTLQKVILT